MGLTRRPGNCCVATGGWSEDAPGQKGATRHNAAKGSMAGNINLLLTPKVAVSKISAFSVTSNEKAWHHPVDRSSSHGSRHDDGDLDSRLA